MSEFNTIPLKYASILVRHGMIDPNL